MNKNNKIDKQDTNQIIQNIDHLFEEMLLKYEQQERSYKNYDLNNQQHVILSLVINHPSYTTSDIAQKMQISKSAISQQLHKLEDKKYIYRYQHQEDKRSYGIGLAENGLKYKQDNDQYYKVMTQKYLDNYSLEELREIQITLEKLFKIID